MFGKSSSSQGELNGFLDAGSHIKGELHFEDTFRIDGKITGNVESAGHLIVGDKGEIEGDTKVRRISVSGTVRGVIRCTERVEITSIGRVYADIHTPVLTMEEGAFLEGRCSMEKGSKSEAARAESGKSEGGKPLSIVRA
jgi:cytoskeletal protein CcmA (bactofilin family)